MADPLRILLNHDDAGDLAARLSATYPAAEIRVADSYGAVPGIIHDWAPQVFYGVRFAGSRGYPREALFGPGGPQWVANGGVGTDHFGIWDPERTVVTNAAGVAAGMMAEYILGGFLHFSLDVPGLTADKASRTWAPRKVRPLAGATLLILGLGHTGRALAQRADALGMRVLGTRARPQRMEHVDLVAPPEDLPELLPQADFIAVSTPLIPATKGMIGRSEISAMKPGVVLADVSRGGVVDQAALARALETGHVAGAALDVFEVEPLPADSRLWALPNVLISPHCSAVYDGWNEKSFDMFLENLARFIAGDPLQNVVDPVRGY